MDKTPGDKPADDSTDVTLNEGASLEYPAAETTDNTSSLITAGPKPAGGPGDDGPKSRNPLRRLWENFNIYLLLFVVVLIIAGVITGVLYVRNRAETTDTPGNISQQNLPSGTLQELASNGVQVGDPKQVLNVQSNSVFAGAVLVRGELQVAGGMKIGSGSLSVPDIDIGGSANINEIQTQELGVAGASRIGDLSVIRNLSVNGTSNFTGSLTASTLNVGRLQLNGDLTITRHLVAGGATPTRANGNALGSGGTTSVSGSDTAGTVSINTGNAPAAGCFTTIDFTNDFASTPHIIISPIGSAAATIDYYINRSNANFSICTASPAAANSTFGFDYHAFE